MNIRFATVEDIPMMVAIGKEMHAESQFSKFDFDIHQTALFIERLITHPDGIVLVATIDGDEIVGGFLGSLRQHFFGNDKDAIDTALFVRQDFRGTRAGYRLIKEYIDCAKAKGAVQIYIVNSTDVDKEMVAAIYKACGFKHLGYVYAMDVEWEY